MSLTEEILSEGGALSSLLPGFTYRPQQIAVARAISTAFEAGEICLAEAGTGVGKTMAYLVPAIEQIRKGKTVVISTHTLNLQGQLMQKDIPLLQEAVGEPGFEAVQVKGMGNYLCRANLEFESSQPLLIQDPMYQKILEWVQETETGDQAEIPFRVANWSELSCDRDSCHRQDCAWYDTCFYYGMRRAAEKAGLLVVNHALFLSDLVIKMGDPGAGILPPYDLVIFDEAHRLEEVAAKTFGIEYSNYRIPSFLNRIRRIKGAEIDPGKVDTVESLNKDLFSLLDGAPRSEFTLPEALDRSRMAELHGIGSRLEIVLKDLHGALTGQARDIGDSDERLRDRLDGHSRTCGRLVSELHAILFEEDPAWFVWGEKTRFDPSQPRRVVQQTLHRTPISVADLLSETFWDSIGGAALLSATLSNSGGFSYVRSRLGIPKAREAVVGSPFDFRTQSLLYVPAHLPFPSNDPEYVELISREIGQIITCSRGRAFILFTSFKMLNAVADRLERMVKFPLLCQGEMPNAALLAHFRNTPNACLLGTNSFWEGVDVQGEMLSCVIIDKLPFSVPDTPMARARMQAVEQAGGNSFSDLSVPEAQIRLKQGFGRLIRTQSDRGVVAILDSRILKKTYGRSFVQVLPPARFTRSMQDVKAFYEAGGSE